MVDTPQIKNTWMPNPLPWQSPLVQPVQTAPLPTHTPQPVVPSTTQAPTTLIKAPVPKDAKWNVIPGTTWLPPAPTSGIEKITNSEAQLIIFLRQHLRNIRQCAVARAWSNEFDMCVNMIIKTLWKNDKNISRSTKVVTFSDRVVKDYNFWDKEKKDVSNVNNTVIESSPSVNRASVPWPGTATPAETGSALTAGS
jgi:hypothetical protein